MVKVDFTDDLDNPETLTSDPYPQGTDTVTGNSQTPQLSSVDAEADEGDDITFTVSSDKTAIHDITVEYATRIRSGDTAEQRDFFRIMNGTATITVGQTEATFAVEMVDKPTEYAGDETFTVIIRNPTGATIGTSEAQGTILQTNQLPQLSFPTTQFLRHENNLDTFRIKVDVSPRSEEPFDFRLDKSGTAEADLDCSLVGETFTFLAFQDQINISIGVFNDTIFEGDETAVLTSRANPTVHRIKPGHGTYELTIQEGEPAPKMSATAYRIGTEGGQNQGTEHVSGQDYANVVFKLELDRAISLPLTVNVEAIDGTAITGQDYQMDTTQVTITAGQQVKYVKAAVINDSDFEGGRNETFQLKVTKNSHNIPGTPIYLTGLIRDNDPPPEGVNYVGGDKDTTGAIAVGESWINDMPILGHIEEEDDQDWYRIEDHDDPYWRHYVGQTLGFIHRVILLEAAGRNPVIMVSPVGRLPSVHVAPQKVGTTPV